MAPNSNRTTSPTTAEQPTRAVEVSVVVPARDAAITIEEQLEALAAQTFDGGWEVIVVDDGSNDATAEIAARWADRLPSFRVLSLMEPSGPSRARNIGTHAASGHLIAYCDADDVVSTGWLVGLVSALVENSLATGSVDVSRLNSRRLSGWLPGREAEQPAVWMDYLTAVSSCNMAVRRETFNRIGGFDEALLRSEDYDFAFRVQLAGETVGYAPEAVVHWRLREGWAFFRRFFDYGVSHVELYRRYRDRGLRRRPLRGIGRLATVGVSAPLVLVPKYRYGWLTFAGVEFGRLKGSVVARTLFL